MYKNARGARRDLSGPTVVPYDRYICTVLRDLYRERYGSGYMLSDTSILDITKPLSRYLSNQEVAFVLRQMNHKRRKR